MNESELVLLILVRKQAHGTGRKHLRRQIACREKRDEWFDASVIRNEQLVVGKVAQHRHGKRCVLAYGGLRILKQSDQ